MASWTLHVVAVVFLFLLLVAQKEKAGVVATATTWGDVVSHFQHQEEVLRRENLLLQEEDLLEEDNGDAFLPSFADYEYVDTEKLNYKLPPPPPPSPPPPGGAPVAERRTLDLLYHVFVDPLRQEALGLEREERRPSLLEDVFRTVDAHILRDLEEWAEYLRSKSSSTKKQQPDEGAEGGGGGGGGGFGAGFQSAIDSLQSLIPTELPPLPDGPVASAASSPQQAAVAGGSGALLTSVRGVAPVATDPDLLLVTDDAGVSHVVSIDDIVGSLAGLDEDTLVSLLFPSVVPPPGGVDLSRPSRHVGSSVPPVGASLPNAVLSGDSAAGRKTLTTAKSTAAPPSRPPAAPSSANPAKPQHGIQVSTLDQILSSLSTPLAAPPAAPSAAPPQAVTDRPQEGLQAITLDQIMASLAQLDDATLAELLLTEEVPPGGVRVQPTRPEKTTVPFLSSSSSSLSLPSSSPSSTHPSPTPPTAKPLVRTDFEGNVHVYPVDSSGVLLDLGGLSGATAIRDTPDGDADGKADSQGLLREEEKDGKVVAPAPAPTPNLRGEEVLAFLKGDHVIPVADPPRQPPSVGIAPDLVWPQRHSQGGKANSALPLLLLGAGGRPGSPSSLNALTPPSSTTKPFSNTPSVSNSLSSLVSSFFLGQNPPTHAPPHPTGHPTTTGAALPLGEGTVDVVVRQRDSFPYSVVGGTTIELPRPIHYTDGGRAAAQRRTLQVDEQSTASASPAESTVRRSITKASEEGRQSVSSNSPSLWSLLTSWWPSLSPSSSSVATSPGGPKAERRSGPAAPAPSSSPVVRTLVDQKGIPDSVKATLLRQLAAKRVRSKVLGALHDQLQAEAQQKEEARVEAERQKRPSSRRDGSVSSYTHYTGEVPVGSTYSGAPSHSNSYSYQPAYSSSPGHSSSTSLFDRDPDLPLFDLYLMAEINKITKLGKDDYSFRKPLIGDPANFVDTKHHHHHHLHHHQEHAGHHSPQHSYYRRR